MLPQTIVLPTTAAPTKRYKHIVTLINYCTGDEQSLTVETHSDRFADVMREINLLRAEKNLRNYAVYEVLDCNDPF